MIFRNREHDLKILNDRYDRKEAALMVVYGRRRVGKTVLLQHWIDSHQDQPHLFWTAHRTTSDVLLGGMSEAVARLTPQLRSSVRFTGWEALFEQLFSLATGRRLLVVVDEFPYLVECAPEVPSILQKLWDQHKSRSRIFLILCGSHYHMMHEQIASQRKPLYGRTTESLVIEEIPPDELHLFLPRYSPEQIVETYSVIGGVPGYLDLWDDRQPVFANIEQKILSGTTFFSNEATLLIQDEIAEPRTYLAILEAIGANRSTPIDLARATGIAKNHIGKYLSTLVDLRFVRRVLSETAQQRSQTRMTRYEIRDPFLRFYFQHIYPHADLVEQRRIARLTEIVRTTWDSYVGSTAYEELSRRRIIQLADNNHLPFVPDYVGRGWTRLAEIDVVAVSWKQRCVLLGECKWQNSRVQNQVLESLMQRAEKFDAFATFKKSYALFSKSGFSKSVEQVAAKEHVLLFRGGGLELQK
jgi:uncharacterized protein